MKSDNAWVNFVRTGSVKNYLNYVREKENEEKREGAYAGQNNDRRRDFERIEYR